MTINLNKLFGHKCQKLVALCLISATAIITGCRSELPPSIPIKSVAVVDENAIDLNTASREELQRIPHVGEVMADRIIAFREVHGGFAAPEQLMLIRGMSDKRFRAIRHLVRTGKPVE